MIGQNKSSGVRLHACHYPGACASSHIASSTLPAQGLLDKLTKSVEGIASGGLEGLTGQGGTSTDLTSSTIANGLREALTIGTETVVAQLGSDGGFLNDKNVRIPLPGLLADAQSALRLAGLSGLADDLETRMNRAAENAVPVAKSLFTDAISALTFEDVMAIYKGPDDAATSYLAESTGDSLSQQMRPIVDDALAQAGALQAFDQLAGQAAGLPLIGSIKTNLTDHVLQYAHDALFDYVALEEKAIRENPTKRTTELLQTVFGG